MEILRRKMGESRWESASVAEYRHIMTVYEGVPAAAGLVRLSARSPVYVSRGESRLKIVDEGFLWLQLAPQGGFWWLTAMYDENARLVQFYFDVTSGNVLCPDGGHRCDDLFVDVVVTPGQPPRIVDEDELAKAVRAGVIGQKTADAALAQARQIAEAYKDCTALEAYCAALLEKLRA